MSAASASNSASAVVAAALYAPEPGVGGSAEGAALSSL